MAEIAANLEVELVARDELDKPGAEFTGYVFGVDPDRRIIRLGYSGRFGDGLADIIIDNYYIVGLWWQPHPMAPLDDAKFSTDKEEQNEAFELIGELLGYDQDLSEDDSEEDHPPAERRETEMSMIAGPKRLEVELAQKKSPQIKRDVVVTSCFPPSGTFKTFTLSGRTKISYSTRIDDVITTFDNTLWEITAIRTYMGGCAVISTSYPHRDSQAQIGAWEKVTAFYEKLHDSEKTVIRNWRKVGGTTLYPDDDDIYNYGEYGHWTNRTPSAYKPPVGVYRVAGDEVGAKIFLEQAQRDVQRPEAEREKSLKELLAEKKVDAREKTPAPAEVSASVSTSTQATSRKPHSDAGRSSAICGMCGSLTCEGCTEEDFMLGVHGVGHYVH